MQTAAAILVGQRYCVIARSLRRDWLGCQGGVDCLLLLLFDPWSETLKVMRHRYHHFDITWSKASGSKVTCPSKGDESFLCRYLQDQSQQVGILFDAGTDDQ